MKHLFYFKMAIEGIKKNKKLYVPYFLISTLWVMMFYIIYTMTTSDTVKGIHGGATLTTILQMAVPIIFLFSFAFLIYMNSFLVKQRNKEYALYSVLGMNKKNIIRLILCDSVVVSTISTGSGTFLGSLLYKLFEVGLIRIIKGNYDFELSIHTNSIIFTVLAFGIIYGSIMVKSVIQMSFTNLSQLLKSQNMGEKPLRGNWILGLLGVVVLGVAYYIAITMKDPLEAISMFFLAVLLVCIGTYLLFISGTVLICKMLQKNKKYYYKANHFFFVSTMAFRMRKHGAGLAAICIFITMILVMISSTFSLYVSEEELLNRRYPREVILSLAYDDIEIVNESLIDDVRLQVGLESEKLNGRVEDEFYYKRVITAGQLKEGEFEFLPSEADSYSDIYQVFFIELSDYNRIYEKEIKLNDDETMVHTFRESFDEKSIKISDTLQYEVKEVTDEFWSDSLVAMNIFPSIILIVNDLEVVEDNLENVKNSKGESILSSGLAYNFNTDLTGEKTLELERQLAESEELLKVESGSAYALNVDSFENGKGEFYGLYGGLFFIGIVLSVLFAAATVLIIYYKQVVEGFEDRGRFEIMRKVGMSKREIQKGINLQVLTVFFLPLIFAGVHLCFAFPIIRQLLLMLNMTNVLLFAGATAICFFVFALIYAVIYYMTSKTYYQIVSK